MRERIISIAEEHREEIIELGKYIHAHPELAFNEYKSSQKCVDLLREHGFEVKEKAGDIDTAFKARFRGGKGDRHKLAFLAEYDALKGLGHACGHNIIASSAVGAAITLSKIADEFDGEIIVMGTPAEEGGGGGKIHLLDKGEFDDVNYAMMMHPSSRNLVGRGGRATMTFDISFHGKSSHSSAQEKGIDALNAMLQLFNGINSIRALLPINSNIHGYIKEGGLATNIITPKASAEFSIRGMTRGDCDIIKEHIERVIRSVEVLTMAKAEYKLEHGYAERYPNATMENEFKRNLESFGERVEVAPAIGKFGSSDIGNVSLKIPTIHSYVKIAESGMSAHTPEFTEVANSDFAYEKGMMAVKTLALTGYRILTDEKFRNDINNEFKRTVPREERKENV